MRGYQSNHYLFFKLRIQWNIDQQARWLYENTRFSIVMYTFIRLHTYILTHIYTQAHFKTTPLHLMFDAWDAWLIAVILLVDRWLPIYYLLHQGQPVLRYFSRFLIIAGSDIPLRDTTLQRDTNQAFLLHNSFSMIQYIVLIDIS